MTTNEPIGYCVPAQHGDFASAQHGAAGLHSTDFDRVLDAATASGRDEPWIDRVCRAAGRGMAVIADDDGFTDAVRL